jgi:hypothetical protein
VRNAVCGVVEQCSLERAGCIGGTALPPSSADVLLGLLFDREDGGDMFCRKVRLSSSYTALELRMLYFSYLM